MKSLRHSFAPHRHASWVCARRVRAFTLIEILVVITIIGLLMALAVPRFVGSIASSRLTTVGDQVLGMLSNAQETANAESRVVEVRFYKYPDPGNPGETTGRFRSVALFRLYQPGEPDPTRPGTLLIEPLAVAIGERYSLPGGNVFSEDLAASSLLMAPARAPSIGGTASAQKTMLKAGASYVAYTFPVEGATYSAFLFRPETTNLDMTTQWCVTVMHAADVEAGRVPPAVPNFYCVQVDAANGRLTSYRPTL